MRPRAFTLVELLVVIGILSVLAAILFPVLSRAREKGRHAACTTHLKQVGLALQAYCNDYDERFPLDADRGQGSFWYERLMPYTRSEELGVCSVEGKRSRLPAGGDHAYEWSYALSHVICRLDMWGGNTLFDLSRIHADVDVARMLMVGEGLADRMQPSWFAASWWQYEYYHVFHHHGLSNALFVDGHVKALPTSARFSAYPGVLQGQ